MQVYVKSKSKKALNERLDLGEVVYCTEHKMLECFTHSIASLPDGTVVKIFDRYVSGSPYAKAYGTIKRNATGQIKVK